MQDEWQSFLQQQSANLIDGLVTDFGNPQAERLHANAENIIADLSKRIKPREINRRDQKAAHLADHVI